MNKIAMRTVIVIILGIVSIAFLGFLNRDKESVNSELTEQKDIQIETTTWKEYLLEEITQDFQSESFLDRRLIGIRDDGQRNIIVSSVKELMGWEKLPGESGFFPVKASFPSYSNKIFFTKYRGGSGHSSGFFMLDVKTLEFMRLTEIGEIYENYYNYASIVSPDGLKIASLGYEALYLLDLISGKTEILSKAKEGEAFFLASNVPDFRWINDKVLQFPVHSKENIYDSPFEIREISL